MLFDTHVHTLFSTDSRMTIEQATAAARRAGLGLTITEHMDLLYPKKPGFQFDVEEYFRTYRHYHSADLLLGLELGMRADCLAENRAIAAGHSFDYIIGSVHVVDNMDIYFEEFYLGRSKQAAYHHYFAAMLDCVNSHDFIHSLGHIDYIARYAPVPDPQIDYQDFQEPIDCILRVLAEREQALEINTKRQFTAEIVQSLLPIYRRFAELGGTLATIGSDSHRADEIGRGFAAARQMAEQAGLKPVYFKNGKPEYMK